jgi:hypothetical protein
MVMLSRIPRRFEGSRCGPFDQLWDDGGGQGEAMVLPLGFVVAPDHGRFHSAAIGQTEAGVLVVQAGTRLGEVRNGRTTLPVHSPFTGQLDRWLVWETQIVAPGQPLCSLRLSPGMTEAS